MISKNLRNKLLSFFGLNKSKFYLLYIQIKVENFKLKYLLHLIKKDNNKLRAFLRKVIYLKEFIIIFIFSYYSLSRGKKLDKDISKNITFIINNNDGWVLEGIANDLANCLNSNYPQLNTNVQTLSDFRKTISNSSKYIFMHQVMTRKIFNFSINLENVFCYYTHTRDLNNKDIFYYSFLKGIFFQTKKELNLLRVNGLKNNNLIHLPVGYDRRVFPGSENLKNREYDFCFSTPFYNEEENPHYFTRKEIKLIEFIAAKLSINGYKVIIIGKGWDKTLIAKNNNCIISNVNYVNKSEILENVRCFLNLSCYEGGPVTLLEAAASGCNVISRDVGIAFDLSMQISNFLLLPECDSYEDYYYKIIEYKTKLGILTQKEYEKNINTLNSKYEFNALAKIIYDSLFGS